MHTRDTSASESPAGSPGREAFPRDHRIGARRDFLAAYDTGLRAQGRLVVVFSRARAEGALRIGLTATRKSGNAVRRNKARRRVREIFRRWRAKVPGAAMDLVVNISAAAVRAPYETLSAEVTRLLERATTPAGPR